MIKSFTLSFRSVLLLCALCTSVQISVAQTETIPTGSFIINMGVTPQTVNNGLKPYGLLYELFNVHRIPVTWSINPAKLKDGIDFSHNGIDYRGGPFIIRAEYRTPAVNATIATWQGKGVVGATTVSPVVVPFFQTLRGAPRWTLDKAKGSIVLPYFTKAEIPASAHGGSSSSLWPTPAQLDCCDDLFVMPHADPVWSTHANLVPWNLNCKGGIWSACHAPSALENMVNPSNRTEQANFLTVKDPNWTGTTGNYTLSNSLILWGSHADGTPPYTHRLPGNPVAQYMGIPDAATQNGSEQIYMPRQGIVSNPSTFSASAVARWRPGVEIIAFDPTQSNVTNPNLSDFRNVAAIIAFGRGFGDPNRGYVMYEAGHSHDGTAPANVAAMRAFFNFSFLSANEKVVLPDLSSVPSTFNSGSPLQVEYDLPPGQDPGDFITVGWNSSCGGSFTPNNTSNPTTFNPPVVASPTPCVISVTIQDLCGRQFTNTTPVTINPCVLTVNRTVTQPACFGQSNGQIAMTISGAPAPYNWNWSRVSPAGTGMGTGTTITGLSAGTYNITVTAGSSCSATFTQLVTQPNLLVATPTVTNYLCFGQSGAVNLSVTGGTAPYTFTWTGPGGPYATQNISGLSSGTYNVTVTDANMCTTTAMATVTGPTAGLSVVLDNQTNVACFGNTTGAINVTTSGGTPGYTYAWNDGNTNEDRTGLAAGTYTLTVTDNNGCTNTLQATITQPTALVLSLSKIDPTCPPGADPPVNADGSIDLSVSGGTSPYSYNWSDLTPPPAEPQDRSLLSAGTYSVTVTDANNCTASISTTLTAQNPLPVAPAMINNN
jgi:hypothetical protein